MFNKPTSEPVGPEQNKMEPVGPGPKIRPVGLGLHALFSKKPETEPDLQAWAQARPTSRHGQEKGLETFRLSLHSLSSLRDWLSSFIYYYLSSIYCLVF